MQLIPVAICNHCQHNEADTKDEEREKNEEREYMGENHVKFFKYRENTCCYTSTASNFLMSTFHEKSIALRLCTDCVQPVKPVGTVMSL